MFTFEGSPVPVREDLKDAHRNIWRHLAGPGPVFNGEQRIRLLETARTWNAADHDDAISLLATSLYNEPATVDRQMVRTAAVESGEPATVEAVSIVSMLSAVDGTHRALGSALEPLPRPRTDAPTRNIAQGFRERPTHLPMPRNSITVALDLAPDEGTAYAALCGPQYMLFAEMAYPDFERSPGLNRAQLEIIASRTSLLNECFY